MNNSFPRINEEVVATLKQAKAEPAFEDTVLEGKEQKYAVVKLSDLAKYNSEFDLNEVAPLMDSLLGNIEAGRERDGKKSFNSYVVINTDEPYIDEIVAVLERNGHWDGAPSNSMKFYEVHEPYYALIMACNVESAMKVYVETVAEDDGTLHEEIGLVGSAYADARFSRARSEDKELVDFQEILETLKSEETQVLLIDGSLL